MAKTRKNGGAKPGSAAELAELFPLTRRIPVRVKVVEGEGETRAVRWEDRLIVLDALSIEELGRVAGHLAPITDELESSPNFLALAIAHPDPILDAVAEAIQWDPARVRAIYSADFVTLARAIIEDNKDFFLRLLGPLVSGMLATMQEARQSGDGPKLSPSSAATTPTPSATH